MYGGAKTRVRVLKVDSEHFSAMMELHYGSTLSLFLFASAIDELARYIQWRCRGNKTVSIFETTIRILGGLISAHLIASDYNTGMRIPSYDDELLHLAEDLAWRMLPAFDTPTDGVVDVLSPEIIVAVAGNHHRRRRKSSSTSPEIIGADVVPPQGTGNHRCTLSSV
ncbi:putative varicose-related protein-like [Capsicum annuum]|nr:putative varicose-related protein-like [Capsicum annuum]